MESTALFGMGLVELTAVMAGLGQKPYRAKQVFDALYKQRVGGLEEVTTLPLELRERMAAEGFGVGLPEIVQAAKSVDGTERYLMRMVDGETVETVWMPDGDGGERGDGSEAAVEEAGEAVTAEEAVAGDEKSRSRSFASLRMTGQKVEVDPDKLSPRMTGQKVEANPNKVSPRMTGQKVEVDPDKLSPRMTGQKIEADPDRVSLRMPAQNGEGRADTRNWGALGAQGFRRATICISSQVGCAVNCQFCLTAKLGIKRNLTAGEIAGQVAAVLNRHGIQMGKDRINLVFMGMGEPFLNYDAFMKSVRVLVGMGISEMRMTVSTSGILPGIEAFARETEMRPKLALSLNASNDGVREQIMPITRKWNISALLKAVGRIPLRPREWVTFEYVLLGGVNDQPEHAREVLALLAGMPAKVNLIVWNPGPGIAYRQPEPEDVAVFQKMLIAGGMPTYIRRPRGRDIYAACGQLKRTVAEDAGVVVFGTNS